MYFIFKLPLLDGYDSILVIVDHFSKGAHIIVANESFTAEQFTFSFFDCLICLHGLLERIVFNKGSFFFLNFGAKFNACSGFNPHHQPHGTLEWTDRWKESIRRQRPTFATLFWTNRMTVPNFYLWLSWFLIPWFWLLRDFHLFSLNMHFTLGQICSMKDPQFQPPNKFCLESSWFKKLFRTA